MSVLDDLLKLWLPTKATRWVAATTIALSVASFGLPETLAKSGISLSDWRTPIAFVAPAAIVLFLGTFVVLMLVLRYLRDRKLNPKLMASKPILLDRAEPLLSILAVVARNYSQELSTTPRSIAGELGMDEDVVLAYMWKYHCAQYMTFRSGGAKPTIETPFFLSPKAWTCITVVGV